MPNCAVIPRYPEYVLHNTLANADQVVAVRVESVAQRVRFAVCVPHNRRVVVRKVESAPVNESIERKTWCEARDNHIP